VNASKSSRYHRSRRRADIGAGLVTATVWAGLLLTGLSLWLRLASRGRPSLYAAAARLILGAALSPLAWYRGYHLERQYELSTVTLLSWVRAQVRSAGLALATGAAAAEVVIWTMRWPRIWWALAAAACAAVTALLTASAPVLALPLLRRSQPLSREVLRHRLERLSARAGIPVLDVREWPLGARSRRASAALVGAGSTRRIVLSDTLLADYSDDEIEVVMAHEMGHHVHRDLLKTLLGELVLLLVGFRAAALVLDLSWQWLGLSSPADPAGLPLVALSVGVIALIATPLLNAWSRAHERRADRFALETASEPAAFIGAVRRMAAQNLAEERPSNTAFLLFHTHPTVEERISAARELLGKRSSA
jgi:STE24 endopeptidase